MKKNIRIILAVLLIFALQTGCGEKDTIYLETADLERPIGQEEFPTEEDALPESVDSAGTTEQSLAEDGVQQSSESPAEDVKPVRNCCVYVCGAVYVPGVYELAEDSRVYEAVAMAGGMTEEAEAAAVNQAGIVQDGQMIYIPTVEEAAGAGFTLGNGAFKTAQLPGSAGTADGRVNLNTATQAELMTLSGIGQAKADCILTYRSEHGGFSSIEEIMQVEGIKEGLYNRIKDHIKVEN